VLRLLGAALAAVVVLAIGGAQPGRPAKARYIAEVRVSADGQLVRGLFDEVVNFDYLPCRICSADERTAVGSDWLGSKRLLRAKLERFADRLETLKPPREVAHLHTQWVSVIRGCERELDQLERRLEVIDNLDVISEFQKKVARGVSHHCFDDFEEIVDAFGAEKFGFASVSWPPGQSRAGFD
jgi:hypothetical protein